MESEVSIHIWTIGCRLQFHIRTIRMEAEVPYQDYEDGGGSSMSGL